MSVLLDTGVLYGALNHDDEAHERATALLDRVGRREFGAPLVLDHVVHELFTLIRSRRDPPALEEAAARLLPLPTPELRGLSIASLGTSLMRPAWGVFRKYRDQRLSFTDAALLASMRELRIDRLATFDRRLASLAPSVP
ncbi:MAG: type II toxin-antitoxin system VapC family toxin [Euryarchaeota archaeon]|nr:type II toxin-antitoxin system VapC family toxin [Euryarchaeota archaeon]MDE1837812.1 type II toxin-antitoxin system VapC family toxin [Euryarchaeota archaeon]MDE1880086.1 type II toxin-antitoxin system VapC family toxin [Euryarchaeota archaeon]MDE2045076.1 type II toxin-antitoxin system VapC family toxin [Thermoplasmata archaeon]